jgi:hypothetical protein
MAAYPVNDSVLRWLETVLAERFGHSWRLSRFRDCLVLTLRGGEGSIMFDQLEDSFSLARSDQPFTRWAADHEGWNSAVGGELPAPGVSRLPAPLIERRSNDHVVHFDILGLCYWMLARVEEIGRYDLDKHGRFPASSSHARRHGYLDRPVVDEWLLVLGQVIQRQWPQIELKRHRFKILLSHDVDRPTRYGFASPGNLIRRMAGDLVRGDVRSGLIGPWLWLNTRTCLNPADPFNTFEWIMDQSERRGLKSAFYFLCGHTDRRRDGDYELEHPAIRSLLRRIHARGHEIGLHPSYNTYAMPEVLKQEADRLRRICSEEGIQQDVWGGRMHFLRWECPATLRAWDDADMRYDSTLSYADHAGFRCGTCFEYPAFDPVSSEMLRLRVRPLIAMEASVLSKAYMGLNESTDGLHMFQRLKHACEKVEGQFTLLWHNSELNSRNMRMYESLLG